MTNIEPQVSCANLTVAVAMSFNNIIGKKKKKIKAQLDCVSTMACAVQKS